MHVCWYSTKEMKILQSFLEFLTISQRKGIAKCVKAAICILSFTELALKLIPGVWPIFKDFQNAVFTSN